MLQKDPAKRPTINKILQNTLIKQRIPYYLSENARKREFSQANLKKYIKTENEHEISTDRIIERNSG